MVTYMTLKHSLNNWRWTIKPWRT